MSRRVLCIVIAITMFFLTSTPAMATSVAEIAHPSIEEILDDYYQMCFEAQNGYAVSRNTNSSQQLEAIRRDTIDTLRNAGYNAYDINPNTYGNVEAELHTDLDEIGVDPNHSYIVVISGEETGATVNPISPQSYGTAGSSFTYTYNGYTHTMRYVTVTAADDSRYYKANQKDLLSGTTSPESIQDCINSAIYALLDAVSKTVPLGTIAEICGIKFAQLDTSRSSSAELFASVSWTRVYTQIYNENTDLWLSWSSVDYAKLISHISGQYYDSTTNSPKSFYSPDSLNTIYSEHFSNTTWRKSQAAAAWQYGNARHEYVGNVKYYHGSNQVFLFPQSILPSP